LDGGDCRTEAGDAIDARRIGYALRSRYFGRRSETCTAARCTRRSGSDGTWSAPHLARCPLRDGAVNVLQALSSRPAQLERLSSRSHRPGTVPSTSEERCRRGASTTRSRRRGPRMPTTSRPSMRANASLADRSRDSLPVCGAEATCGVLVTWPVETEMDRRRSGIRRWVVRRLVVVGPHGQTAPSIPPRAACSHAASVGNMTLVQAANAAVSPWVTLWMDLRSSAIPVAFLGSLLRRRRRIAATARVSPV